VTSKEAAGIRHARATADKAAAQIEVDRLTGVATEYSEKSKVLSAGLEEAQAAYDRIRLAMDLSSHRANLRSEEPCPLCGSEEHPWREDDAVARVVGAQEARVLTLRSEVEALGLRIAETASNSEMQCTLREKAQEESERLGKEVESAEREATKALASELLQALSLTLELSTLQSEADRLRDCLSTIGGQLAEAEALDKALREASAAVAAAQSKSTAVAQLCKTTEATHLAALARLSACQGFRYRARGTLLARAQSALAVCETRRQAAPQWIPEEEQAAVAGAQTEEQAATQNLVAATEKLKNCGARVEQGRLASSAAESLLEEALVSLDRSKEQLLEQLAVTEAWLQNAEQEVHLAQTSLASATGTLAERTLRCQELQAKKPSEPSEEIAASKLAALVAELEGIVEEGVKVGTALQLDKEARERRDALGKSIQEAMERVRVFRILSDLIGSADGKKFRVFAQSLTLESLLVGANTHLKELAPRYLLERVPGHDLDLQVIDQDLADEVRSVHSLSGGESFLISLALALGLSSLASQEVRVESLLVDEGFGSLDGDTLEVALSVLDSLQATGRKVGLISHVPGFAERIGAQVIVTPLGGGRSSVRVQGPMSAL